VLPRASARVGARLSAFRAFAHSRKGTCVTGSSHGSLLPPLGRQGMHRVHHYSASHAENSSPRVLRDVFCLRGCTATAAGVTPSARDHSPTAVRPFCAAHPRHHAARRAVQPWCTGFRRVELAPKHQRARRRVNLTFHTGNGMLMSIFRLCAVKPPRNRPQLQGPAPNPPTTRTHRGGAANPLTHGAQWARDP
jgi:hypothetical protein